MSGLLRAETVKLRGRWLYWVMVGILAVVVGLTAFFFLVFPRIAPDQMAGFGVPEKPSAYLLGASQVLGQTWFPVILAVVMLGSETGSSIWAATLTRESRRWLHGAVKLVVLTVASWLAMLAAIAGWAVVTALVAEGTGAPGMGTWAGVVWKTGLVQLTWIALGLAAAAALRSVGPAVGVGLALSFGEGLVALWRPWQEVSISSATTWLLGDVADLGGMVSGAFGEPMGQLQAVAVLVGWAVLGAVVLVAGLQLRDP